ncbi:FAD-binding domain-containing protein [Lentinula edodes]|nr:FAD-binding domain-containing protein [Lentinula edodes]
MFLLFIVLTLIWLNLVASLPTLSDWNALNYTLKGRLIRSAPFALPCFSVTNGVKSNHNTERCASVIDKYLDDGKDFSLFIDCQIKTQWETCQSKSCGCLLDSDQPGNPVAFSIPQVCSQGSVPKYTLPVDTVSDVVASLNFAKTFNVPLVIKNTGHDYKGRSSASGALSLWMHNLQAIMLSPNFTAVGCSNMGSITGITFGAGTSFLSLMTFAEANNLTVPTAGDGTVAGGGGYLQGGGHSVLSNAFGLAVDRVLQFEVVTPSGQHVFANSCQFQDLFFALRGGGGGTFGIILGITTLALPQMKIHVVQANIEANQGSRLVEFMVNHSLHFAQSGWGGFTLPSTGLTFVNAILTSAQAEADMEPLQKFVTQQIHGNFTFSTQPTYKSYYEKFTTNVPRGTPLAAASRLVPANIFHSSHQRKELTAAINGMAATGLEPIIFAAAPFLYGDRGGTSVTPAWRSSLLHVVLTDGWDFNSSLPEIRAVYRTLSTAMDPLRKLTPTSGAYQNEADVFEPDHEDSFWGENYQQLVSIKHKYDPDHLLDCWQCVGWTGPDDLRYECYPSL